MPRARAADAAAKIDAAENERADLEVEIAQSETEIVSLRARTDELRARVRERAARLYVFSSKARLQAFVDTSSVIDASRAAHFTETVGDHDQSVANELQDTARQLQERNAQLRARQAELDSTIASLVPLRGQLDDRIERAVTAYQQSRAAPDGADEPPATVAPPDGAAPPGVAAPPATEDVVWDTFRECTFAHESGGNYRIVSPDGLYYGAWQFAIGTWNAVAGRMGRDDLVGVLPSDASPEHQDAVAHALWLESGNRPWGGRC